MTSLYNTVGWKTSSMQDLKDQTKKLQRESDLRKLQNTIRDSISEGIRAQTVKEGISLKIENEDGQVFFRPNGTLKCNSALNIELKNKGFNGKIYVEPGASTWFTGGWAKALVLAGTVYLYRNELRIIGRGVLAGANLAIERWEQRQRQKDGDVKGKEVEEEKEQGKEEDMIPVTPTEEEDINQNASIYPPPPPPVQPPHTVSGFDADLDTPTSPQSLR
ncbi:uncharacterized protein J4E92_003553 [Alternaria infectoria]|uniref:uncharacterized protein n=1 Tax=Alternaria infectoria TaxID=45303 RepID=UPI0022201FA9|nr:uncharacterized protein J4E92_003553 [Alternaria infectoria]KAI4933884.1 hypothetical protein J4E92_003553 [Alternaria infectoria]